MIRNTKNVAAALTFLGALIVSPSTALADIRVAGDTTETAFSNGQQSWEELTFSSGAFDVTSSGSPVMLAGEDKLGSLALGDREGPTNLLLGRDNFHLTLTFTMPEGLLPKSTTFTADILGVASRYGGFATVFFSDWTQDFTFKDDSGGVGSFTLSLSPTSVFNGKNVLLVTSNHSIDVTGKIENVAVTTVPEPGVMVSLVTMLLGVGLWGRKSLFSVRRRRT